MEAIFVVLAVTLGLIVFLIASMWKVFEKAGEPGWAAVVPIYNLYVLTCKIAGKDVGWFILEFVPLVNIITSLLVAMEIARKFRQSDAFGIVGLWMFPFVGFPILAFGNAEYSGGGRWEDRDEPDDWADRGTAPWSQGGGRGRKKDTDW
jgi:hypothetical protein